MSTIRFRTREIACGWYNFELTLNDKTICFCASYIGNNPLEEFITGCLDYLVDMESLETYPDSFVETKHYITLNSEPELMHITMEFLKDNHLRFHVDKGNEDGKIYEQWDETVTLDEFHRAIVDEGFRVLNAFGLAGYKASWNAGTEFPLAALLRLAGMSMPLSEGDSYWSDLRKELDALHARIDKPAISAPMHMDKCTVYYEAWQIQCCGDPFKVGERVEWTVLPPDDFKNAHGIIIDFQEDHHSFASLALTGTITGIIAERSEFPRGSREVIYHKAKTIKEPLDMADGWKSDYKDDDKTQHTFWGYIVILEDVTVSPLVRPNQGPLYI